MSLDLVEDLRTDRLDLIRARIDAAATPGKLLLYPGAKPALGAATLETLQATIILEQPCGVTAAAVLTFETGMEGTRMDTQDITWGRFVDGDDAVVADANVTATGGGGTIQISSISGLLGGLVRLESGTIGE
jgi:hypothetical protein